MRPGPRGWRRCSICATGRRRWRGSASAVRAQRRAQAAAVVAPSLSRRQPPRGERARGRAAASTPSTASSSPRTPRAAERVLTRAGYRVSTPGPGARPAAVLRPHLPRRRPGRRGAAEARRMVDALAPVDRRRHADRRARALVPADPARRISGAAAGRRGQGARRARAAVRGIRRRASARPAGSSSRSAPMPGQHRAAARPLPPEGVRHGRRRGRRRCS